MFFALPAALWGLLSVPALLAIYFLIGRSKPHVVSSLFLWTHRPAMPRRGAKWQKFRAPLLMLLEVLVLLLLALAAARPVLPLQSRGAPLVLVLDDSLSMVAGSASTARTRAERKLREVIKHGRYHPVRAVLAGTTPRLMETEGDGAGGLDLIFEKWTCASPTDTLADALGLARDLGEARAHFLVITDRAPENEIDSDRIQWLAMGKPMSNTAITNAARTRSGATDRCLLEISHYGESIRKVTLSVTGSDSRTQQLQLEPGQVMSLVLEEPADAGAVSLSLPDDALLLDNRVWLAPPIDPEITVGADLADTELLSAVRAAITMAGNVRWVETAPDFLVTDSADRPEEPTAPWSLIFPARAEAVPLMGPFIIDRRNPVSEGLDLGGVIWPADLSARLPGVPVILADDLTLLADLETNAGHRFYLNFQPALSNLEESPNWPIFFWNLLRVRARAMPGLTTANHRLGQTIAISTDGGSISLTTPESREQTLAVKNGALSLDPTVPGLYSAVGPSFDQSFAVNALIPDESDLTGLTSGKWGDLNETNLLQRRYRDLTGPCIIAALIALAMHGIILRRVGVEV